LSETRGVFNFRKISKSFMGPTDGKATNGFENEIRWSFLIRWKFSF
jgi:hypothetical protein